MFSLFEIFTVEFELFFNLKVLGFVLLGVGHYFVRHSMGCVPDHAYLLVQILYDISPSISHNDSRI